MAKNVFTKSDGFKSEYSCAVTRIGNLIPIEGSDFLAKTEVFGTQIVVRKDQVKTGDIMLYAANETALSEKFLSVNNLYEIGCREKNANKVEVDEIMKPYEPIRAKADALKAEEKNIKGAINNYTKKAQKAAKFIRKKEKELSSLPDDDPKIASLNKEIKTLNEQSEKFTQEAMSRTTTLTNLKKEREDTVKSGSHIIDEAKKHCGFFNKYGRVRCITLRNTPSFGFLFSPAELFKYDSTVTMEDIEEYEGKEFDTVNGDLFVKVFVPPMSEVKQGRKGNKNKAQNKLKNFDRMIDGEFAFHYTTTQLEKIIQFVKPDDVFDISVKLHGTSVIISKVHVKQQIKLPFFKRMFNKFIDATGLLKSKRITDYIVGYGPVYSSRTVIKNRYINKSAGEGYYKQDVWSEYGDIVYPYLEDGMTVYGEICGYLTNSDSMIQKTYDYGNERGRNFLMIYRISTTDKEGKKKEWEIPEVLDWTNKLIERMKMKGDTNYIRIHPIDLKYHGTLADLYPEIDTENHWQENVLEALKNDKEHFGMEENEPLCKNKVPREGIVLRKENDDILEAAKLKCIAFKLGEAIRMDAGDVDVEMSAGYGDNF